MNFLRMSLIMALSFSVGYGKSEPKVDAVNPFLHAKLSLDLVDAVMVEATENSKNENKRKKLDQLKANILLLKALGLKDFDLLVAKKASELKILVSATANEGFLKAVSANALCTPFLTATDDKALFDIKLPEKKNLNQKLMIGQFGKTVVLGSNDLVEKCMADKKLPELSQTKRFETSVNNPQLSITVACGENIEQSFKDVVVPMLTDAKADLGVSPMIVGFVNSIAKALSKPLESIEGFNASISLKGDTRHVNWKQWNRNSQKLSEQIKNIKSSTYLDFADESIVGALMSMKSLNPKVDLNGKALNLSFGWDKKEDKASLAELKKRFKSVMSSLFSNMMSSNGEKSKNAPSIKYGNLFDLDVNYTVEDLKKKLPQQVKKAITYSRFSKGHGTRPSKESFETGKVNVVNSDLCSFKYEPKGLFVGDQNILKVGKGRSYGSQINFQTESKEKAQRAEVTVKAQIPQNIKVLGLTGADLNKVKIVGKTKVLLKELTASSVKIATSAENATIKVFAFDNAGRCLASKKSKQTGRIFTGRFYGTVHKVKLYVYETSAFSFDLSLVVPKEKWKFPKDPTTEILPRYETRSPVFYNNPGLSKLENLSVSYNTENKSLVLNLDKAGLKLTDKWSCTYFGKGKELNPPKSWGSFSMMRDSIKYVKKSISNCKDCEVVFGTVEVKINAGLKVFEVSKDKPVSVTINGDIVKLSINKNRVELFYPKENKTEMVSVIGYDQKGKILKKYYNVSWDTETVNSVRFNKRGYQFFGAVDHALVQINTKTVKKEIPFELFLTAAYDKAAYQKLKLKKVEDRRMFSLLKLLKKKQQVIVYEARQFPALSGLYYVVDKWKKKLVAGIPIEVAQSNKLGAAIFGYTCKPYKGYYFSYPTEVLKKKKLKKLKSTQKHKFTYQKNGQPVTGDFSKFDAEGSMLAIPQDFKANSIYFLGPWDKVYRYTGEKKIVTCGPDLYGQDKGDWIELKF